MKKGDIIFEEGGEINFNEQNKLDYKENYSPYPEMFETTGNYKDQLGEIFQMLQPKLSSDQSNEQQQLENYQQRFIQIKSEINSLNKSLETQDQNQLETIQNLIEQSHEIDKLIQAKKIPNILKNQYFNSQNNNFSLYLNNPNNSYKKNLQMMRLQDLQKRIQNISQILGMQDGKDNTSQFQYYSDRNLSLFEKIKQLKQCFNIFQDDSIRQEQQKSLILQKKIKEFQLLLQKQNHQQNHIQQIGNTEKENKLSTELQKWFETVDKVKRKKIFLEKISKEILEIQCIEQQLNTMLLKSSQYFESLKVMENNLEQQITVINQNVQIIRVKNQ